MDLLKRIPLHGMRALLGLAAWLIACAAPAQQPLEQAVKSAYVFRFGEYVAWPDDAFAAPDAPFVIGTFGDDAMAANLEEAVRGRNVGGRTVVVRRLRDLDDARGVQVLFVRPSRGTHGDDVETALRGLAVLTVSDKSSGSGTIIQFVRQENKVRFEIDAGAAERCGLKLSSKLLSLAVAVTGTP